MNAFTLGGSEEPFFTSEQWKEFKPEPINLGAKHNKPKRLCCHDKIRIKVPAERKYWATAWDDRIITDLTCH